MSSLHNYTDQWSITGLDLRLINGVIASTSEACPTKGREEKLFNAERSVPLLSVTLELGIEVEC